MNLKFLSISCVLLLAEGVSLSPRSDFSYSFYISPLIHPNSNLTFVLYTRNSSPSDSYRLSFDILNRKTNQTIASADSKQVPPGSVGKKEVRLEIPRDVSVGPFALRTHSFRLNHPHPPKLEEETLHKVHLDLRNSTILIFLDKWDRGYAQGEWVKFSAIVLDKQRRLFRTERKVSISIWKTSPERFLIRRFPAVSIRPERAFVTGAFRIPQKIYEDPYTVETFQILVTLDERSPDDPSILLGLAVPQSAKHEFHNQNLQWDESLFYSIESREVTILPKSPILGDHYQQGSVGVTLDSPFLTLTDPQVNVEVKVTNPLGLPSPSGHCKFKYVKSVDCISQLNHTANFTNGKLSTRLNLSETFDPDCLRKNVLPTTPSLDLELNVFCTHNVIPASDMQDLNKLNVYLSAGNFLIAHAHVASPTPSLVFRVTGKNSSLPLGPEVTAGTTLEVTYVFHNGSQVRLNESLLEGGLAEHTLRDFLDLHDLSHMTAQFKDSGPLRIDKCDGCPEKVKTQKWLTKSRRRSVTAGESLELIVVSPSPVSHLHLRLTNYFGMEWETLEPVTLSKVISPSRFVTYVNFTFPRNVKHVKFIDGDLSFYIDPEVAPPLEINEDAKPLIVLSPPKGDLNLFGIKMGPDSGFGGSLLPGNPYDVGFEMCQITSGGTSADLDDQQELSNCPWDAGNSTRDRTPLVPDAYVEVTVRGAKDIPVELNLEQTPRKFEDGWLWNSSLTSSDALSITALLPDGATKRENIFGILIDDFHGLRVTSPPF